MGGRSDKTKLILISTLVEAVVEVEVELGNIQRIRMIKRQRRETGLQRDTDRETERERQR